MERRVMATGPKPEDQVLTCGHLVGESPTNARQAAGVMVDCRPCDHRVLPPQFTLGRRTPVFVATTVPPGLLREHHTSTWARLEVEAGSVTFLEEQPPWRATVVGGDSLTIVPDRVHRIEPSEDARFAVQFFDAPNAASANEPEGIDTP